MGRASGAAFLERSVQSLLDTADYAARAEARAESHGLLQGIDPRVKLGGVAMMVFAAVYSRGLLAIWAASFAGLVLAAASGIRWRVIAASFWIPALLFTGAIALPAVFIVPGTTAFVVGPFMATQAGLRSAAFLVSRSVACVTLSALLVFSTPWPLLLKALRAFRVPAIAVAMLGMTYRYLFAMLAIARDMLESRRSRAVGVLPGPERRRIAAAAAGVLLSRGVQLSREVHLSMLSRGYRGDAWSLDERPVYARDWAWLAGFAMGSACLLLLGR